MTSLNTTIRYWTTIATKMSSYIGWRGAWRNMCLNSRVWPRWINRMVDLRKISPWQKTKHASMWNEEQGMNKSTNIRKGVEWQTIAVGFEARAETCGTPTTRKMSYKHREKGLHPPTTIHLQLKKISKKNIHWHRTNIVDKSNYWSFTITSS